MTNAVRGRRDASNTSTDDGNFRSSETRAGRWWIGCKYDVSQPLEDLKGEQERMEDGIMKTGLGTHVELVACARCLCTGCADEQKKCDCRGRIIEFLDMLLSQNKNNNMNRRVSNFKFLNFNVEYTWAFAWNFGLGASHQLGTRFLRYDITTCF